MESATNGHRKVLGRGRNAGLPATARQSRLERSDPRSRAINRSSRASIYASFADEIHRDLNPRGVLERLVADHVVHHAWKLKANLEKQAARDRSDKADPDAEPGKGRIRSTELDRASRALREALESLDFLRKQVRPATGLLDIDEVDAEILPNEWPVVPGDDLEEDVDDPHNSEDEVPTWQERLIFDFEVSDISPVVKGTWVTVSHVVSLIVDGWSWTDILRSHPELTEDDIRTCVAFAVSEDNTAP